MTLLLAQISDTHIVGPNHDEDLYVDNNARLAEAVERIQAESVRPDAIIATGDMTDLGTDEEMAILLDLLAPLDIPILAVPGNHDRRPSFRSAFDLPWADERNLSWIVDLGPLHVVGLDTLVTEQNGGNDEVDHNGLFDDTRAAWLDEALRSTAVKPTAIVMHHPPFASGIGWMDAMGLHHRERFADVVSGHDHVVRILCGHLHRPITTVVGGVVASTGISTIQQVELNLAADAPVELICDPPGYQLHQFDGAGGWVTHTRHFDTGASPIRPAWDG